MITYESLAPILHSQAYKLASNSHGRYIAHELIAECLLKGKCQQLPDIKIAYKRIRYDMIDYMRKVSGERRCKHLTFITLDIKIFNPQCVDHVDLKDEIRYIFQNLSERDVNICRMLRSGYTKSEICEILKIPRGSLGYRLSKIRDLFRERFQPVSS